ncbi:hypothetical protein, partial [Xenorhabdus bovienii]|uniref:hypothetical protein n=1 Tax=Xenorhabdus bovienii TaxID=40576 RepID=UPI003B96D917|nr:hypothetical protein [Xenorhabdus bovienii]
PAMATATPTATTTAVPASDASRGEAAITPPGEAVIVEPAFGMYADCVGAVGGRARFVAPGPELTFPLDATLAAIDARTRLVFLTNPGN